MNPNETQRSAPAATRRQRRQSGGTLRLQAIQRLQQDFGPSAVRDVAALDVQVWHRKALWGFLAEAPGPEVQRYVAHAREQADAREAEAKEQADAREAEKKETANG